MLENESQRPVLGDRVDIKEGRKSHRSPIESCSVSGSDTSVEYEIDIARMVWLVVCMIQVRGFILLGNNILTTAQAICEPGHKTWT